MSKEEIKALVAAKIAGQGSAVDAGGALAPIFNAIIDLIPEGYTLPAATAETLGGVKVGSRLSITEEGVLSAEDQSYSLPAASAETLGGIKVGSNLSITEDGVLSAQGGSVEPLIVNVVFDKSIGEASRVDEEGNPTLLQCYNAFMSGRPVFAYGELEDYAENAHLQAIAGGFNGVDPFCLMFSDGVNKYILTQVV